MCEMAEVKSILLRPLRQRTLLSMLVAASLLDVGVAIEAGNKSPGPRAPKPLYRDPVYDGAADPVVIWNPHVRRWWMFYTNRRANVPGLSGVAWVHGTRIGIAESADGGVTWKYIGTADIELPVELAGAEPTHWAPEVITAPNGIHHMFLTVVPGVFEDWNHPRAIVHLTSTDLRRWEDPEPLQLASDRVIDGCVLRLPDGAWRMWYNNERDRKSIYFADSPDLRVWADRGKAVGDQAGEGPKVFQRTDSSQSTTTSCRLAPSSPFHLKTPVSEGWPNTCWSRSRGAGNCRPNASAISSG